MVKKRGQIGGMKQGVQTREDEIASQGKDRRETKASATGMGGREFYESGNSVLYVSSLGKRYKDRWS